jgi:hypothetical protein
LRSNPSHIGSRGRERHARPDPASQADQDVAGLKEGGAELNP